MDPPPKWIPLNDPCLQWIRSQPPSTSVGSPEPAPLIQLWKVVTANAGRSTAAQTSAHEQWKKVPLLFTRFGGDEKLTSYVRKCFINHEIRIPFLSTCFFLGDIHFPWLFEAFWLKSERNNVGEYSHAFLSILTSLHHEFKSFSPSTHKADPPFAGEGGHQESHPKLLRSAFEEPIFATFFWKPWKPKSQATCHMRWCVVTRKSPHPWRWNEMSQTPSVWLSCDCNFSNQNHLAGCWYYTCLYIT